MERCLLSSRLFPVLLLAWIFACPRLVLSSVPPRPSDDSASSAASITIPGPLRSFLRMAAVSQQVSPGDVLPLVAHNVVTDGYRGYGKGERPTEYLVLLKRYVQQARELRSLAGPDGVIRVANCQGAESLLKVLGYHPAQPCGPTAALETAEPERAFLTIDSGFPLTDLELTLREGKPFEYSYPAFQVPVIFTPADWTKLEASRRKSDDLIDCLLLDARLARLYWAMSRIDSATQSALRQSPGLEKLLPLAPVLDFYGSNLCIRAGRVEVPGGPSAEGAWKSLVGASPNSPADFVDHLLSKDEGWAAAYFDALSCLDHQRQVYFSTPLRLQRFYEALRGKDVNPSPVRPVFRPDAGLLLLAARLQFEPDGQPHIPGNLDVWRAYLQRRNEPKLARQWGKRASGWSGSEQVLEAMFGLSRLNTEQGPLQVFLLTSAIDRGRSAQERLRPQTVRLLIDKYPRFGDQYRVFCEFSGLNDSAISDYLRVAEALDHAPSRTLRGEAIGLFQANIGLWQILARQGEIPASDWSGSWRRVVSPFASAHSMAELYDAARASLGETMRAAGGKSRLTQDEFIDLLAGPPEAAPDAQEVEQDLANRIRTALDAQRPVSLDTLLQLGDALVALSKHQTEVSAVLPLAGELREFQMPKPLFSSSEKVEWTPGLANNPHLQLEANTDLARTVKSAKSPEEWAAARGLLVPYLRDTLVGLNYAYFAPPDTQLMTNHPMLVRSHDFSGGMSVGLGQSWTTPSLVGRGWTAGGGAHLAGSLADLPYVLSELEQDFVVPENVQSLVWEDMVPTLLTAAVLPRWWSVSGDELHAVTLYQRFGEDLVKAAAQDEKLALRVMDILEGRLLPQRFAQVQDALHAGNATEALSRLAPAETFFLGADFQHRFPKEVAAFGKTGSELQALVQEDPQAVNWERLSADFGVPHPAFAQTYARELMEVKPLPTYLGYSSRLLAESWDSNNLYWARLADEMGYAPVMLNIIAPQLTRRMVGKIFATHLEDWPALLRALRETGAEFRAGKIASMPKSHSAPGS